MKIWLASTLLATLSAFASGPVPLQPSVVYGEDNRQDVFQASAANQLLARSTAAKMYLRDLAHNQEDDTYSVPETTFGESANMCSDERFLHQPVAAECTGFLVGPDLLVTAGHCVDDQAECDSAAWVFDYQANSATGRIGHNMPAANVFQCNKVITKAQDDGGSMADYALVQLKRVATGREPLRVRTDGRMANNAVLTLIGNGAKLPTKVVAGSHVIMNDHREYFSTDSDSFEGNSGSPVINEATLMVEGIMVRGAEDFTYDNVRMCGRVNHCPPEGCNPSAGQRGEEATRITLIAELRLQQKVLNAARSGDIATINGYIENGHWIDIYDNQRQSMLVKAIQGEQLEVMRALIRHGADKMLKDLRGETPLHAAVRAKNIEAVRLLLAAGVNPEARNSRGQRAIDLCEFHSVKQRKIRALLQSVVQNNG